jgi:hypothetical protein
VAWALRFRVQEGWMTPYFLKSFSRNNNVAIKVWQHFVGINVTIPPFATRAHLANAILMQGHQAVEDVITQYPEVVAIDHIETSLPSAPNRRTLQRWLNALMTLHRIRRKGHARAVKYWRIKPVDLAEQAMRQPVGYKRSCARYSAVRQPLGDPDPFRLQHRKKMTEVVAHVVRQK